jgi:hypothetical protein
MGNRDEIASIIPEIVHNATISAERRFLGLSPISRAKATARN